MFISSVLITNKRLKLVCELDLCDDYPIKFWLFCILQDLMKRRNLCDRVVLTKLICYWMAICIAKFVIQIGPHSGDVDKHGPPHTNVNAVQLHVMSTELRKWNCHSRPVNTIICHWLNPYSVECNSLTINTHKDLYHHHFFSKINSKRSIDQIWSRFFFSTSSNKFCNKFCCESIFQYLIKIEGIFHAQIGHWIG